MDDKELLLEDDECDVGITIPTIHRLGIGEIADQIVWPDEMDRIALYRVDERGIAYDPLYLVISKGRINRRIAHLNGEVPNSAVLCIEPDGRHVTKFISYGKYNIHYVANECSYALVEDRVVQVSKVETFFNEYGKTLFGTFAGLAMGMLLTMAMMGILFSQIKTTN